MRPGNGPWWVYRGLSACLGHQVLEGRIGRGALASRIKLMTAHAVGTVMAREKLTVVVVMVA
jgi:hypothetical protein